MTDTPVPIVYILVGYPFAGKTTYSKILSEKLAIPRVSFDDEWEIYVGEHTTVPGKNGIEQWQYINTYCEKKVENYLKKGISVVYDNMNNHLEHRERVKQLAHDNGAKSQILFIDVSLKEIHKRRAENLISAKRHQVSDENFNNAVTNFELPSTSETPLTIRNAAEFEKLIVQMTKA